MSKDKDLRSEVASLVTSCGLLNLLPDPPEPTPEERIADALEKLAEKDD